MTHKILFLLTAMTAGAIAQTPVAFDVTSIKPSASVDDGYSINTPPGGRFVARNITISTLIQVAYDIRLYQLSGGPGWVDSERYDIEAKAAVSGTLTPGQLQFFCTALLSSRFGLKVHNETKELPQYALVAAKSGLKLKPDTSGAQLPSVNWGRGYMDVANVSMAVFAKVLSTQLERNVVDFSGATGKFDFKVTWSAEEAVDSTSPSIFTALQEQYGLKVESRKGPTDTVVIDHIDRPSDN